MSVGIHYKYTKNIFNALRMSLNESPLPIRSGSYCHNCLVFCNIMNKSNLPVPTTKNNYLASFNIYKKKNNNNTYI